MTKQSSQLSGITIAYESCRPGFNSRQVHINNQLDFLKIFIFVCFIQSKIIIFLLSQGVTGSNTAREGPFSNSLLQSTSLNEFILFFDTYQGIQGESWRRVAEVGQKQAFCKLYVVIFAQNAIFLQYPSFNFKILLEGVKGL